MKGVAVPVPINDALDQWLALRNHAKSPFFKSFLQGDTVRMGQGSNLATDKQASASFKIMTTK